MKPKKRKFAFQLLASMMALIVAAAGAASALEAARLVDIVAIVGGAFGAGASFVAAIHSRRAMRAENQQV